MRSEFIVAGKEFRDHLTSKRFIVVFAILMLLSIIGMVNGMNDYNNNLESYKKMQAEPWYQEQIAELQKRIAYLEANGASEDEITEMKYQLEKMINPDMPSVMYVFNNINQYFVFIGAVLGISLGFDLISREKEEGSLKSLLSHPVFRDSILNGKALGAIGMLTAVMASVFFIIVAIMLFYGVVPTGNDFSRIVVYFIIALVYCMLFFAVSLMMSTVAKSSAMSILYVLGVVVALFVFGMMSYQVVQIIVGQPPQPPDGPYPVPIVYESVSSEIKYQEIAPEIPDKVPPLDPDIPPMSDEWKKYQEDMQKYWDRYNMVSNAIGMVSPMDNFNRISATIINRYGPVYGLMDSRSMISYQEQTVWDSLVSVWPNLLVIFVEMIIALAVSYVKFLRMDIR
ncbi:ABC transporter [Methanocella sp. CWC-04]|uniref:ABC transporter n=1 Tax=Methanooceanicella nereidis TaxID=2052831 RepID=A0AAP2W793_9EURY|nr:ABC transporter permease subunit [Methanocella sp. CWC-04]MCD1294989.1 ABC transporter [Methanocella sp. CWC-04]